MIERGDLGTTGSVLVALAAGAIGSIVTALLA
jgi:hypothetical protein